MENQEANGPQEKTTRLQTMDRNGCAGSWLRSSAKSEKTGSAQFLSGTRQLEAAVIISVKKNCNRPESTKRLQMNHYSIKLKWVNTEVSWFWEYGKEF